MVNREECVVITPYHNRIEPQVDIGLRELEKRGFEVWREPGYSAIDFGRCVLATRALERGFKETLWIDSDVEFDPDEIDSLRALTWSDILNSTISNERVLQAIKDLSNQYDSPGIVCGLYVKKVATGFACSTPSSTDPFTFGIGGGPIVVPNSGAGMLLVRDWAYFRIRVHHRLPFCNEKQPHRLVPYFLPMVLMNDDGEASYLCEDYAFCERAKMAGIPIIADSRMRLFHYGTYGFSWEDIHNKIPRFNTYNATLSNSNDMGSSSGALANNRNAK